jgi:hypothetical protein
METKLQTQVENSVAIDEKVDRIMAVLKRIGTAFVLLLVFTVAFILLIEIKRAYNIDLIDGVNFKVDDWYFSNTGR